MTSSYHIILNGLKTGGFCPMVFNSFFIKGKREGKFKTLSVQLEVLKTRVRSKEQNYRIS